MKKRTRLIFLVSMVPFLSIQPRFSNASPTGFYLSVADSKLMQVSLPVEVTPTTGMTLPRDILNGFPLLIEKRPKYPELYIIQASYDSGASIAVVDLVNRSVGRKRIQGIIDYQATACFSPDGRYLLVSGIIGAKGDGREKVLHLIEIENWRVVHRIQADGVPNSFVFSDDGGTLHWLNVQESPKQVSLDLRTLRQTQRSLADCLPQSISLGPMYRHKDGRLIVESWQRSASDSRALYDLTSCNRIWGYESIGNLTFLSELSTVFLFDPALETTYVFPDLLSHPKTILKNYTELKLLSLPEIPRSRNEVVDIASIEGGRKFNKMYVAPGGEEYIYVSDPGYRGVSYLAAYSVERDDWSDLLRAGFGMTNIVFVDVSMPDKGERRE